MRLGISLLFFICIVSCESNPSPIHGEDNLVAETAVYDTTIADSADTFIQNEIQDSVLFIFTYTDSWCNGSYPSDEIQVELATPRRLYHTPLLLKNEQGDIFHLITDKKGRVKILVTMGNYTVHFNPDADYKKSPVNISCDLYFEPTWGEIKINADQTEVKLNIHLPCDLCDPAMKKRS